MNDYNDNNDAVDDLKQHLAEEDDDNDDDDDDDDDVAIRIAPCRGGCHRPFSRTCLTRLAIEAVCDLHPET